MKMRIRLMSVLLVVALGCFMGLAAQSVNLDLLGSNEVPPVVTQASGSCTGTLNAAATQFDLDCAQSAGSVIGAHIHAAPAGVNGPIVFVLGAATTMSASVNAASLQQQVDDAQPVQGWSWDQFLDALRTGELYVNVHSVPHPSGELRGQIPAPSHSLYFPQFGGGSGITSDIVLLNTSATTATGEVSFYRQDGSPFAAVGGASAVDFELPGFGSMHLTSTEEGDQPIPGSAIVQSDRRIGANLTFNVATLITGVAPSVALETGVVPVDTTPGAVRTAVALQNPDESALDLLLTLLDPDGVVIDQVAITLTGHGQTARFIDEIFNLGGLATHGVLKVEAESANGRFAGVGVQQGSTQFTTVPFTRADE